MNKRIQTLKAQLRELISAIEEAYSALSEAEPATNDQSSIVVSYFLHVIYGHFENLFVGIARAFENQIEDQSQWHAELLERMTLDIEGIRPAVISKESLLYLDEMRRFRHLFRNAYLLRFDPERLALVLRDARRLQACYGDELNAFLIFLDSLIDEES